MKYFCQRTVLGIRGLLLMIFCYAALHAMDGVGTEFADADAVDWEVVEDEGPTMEGPELYEIFNTESKSTFFAYQVKNIGWDIFISSNPKGPFELFMHEMTGNVTLLPAGTVQLKLEKSNMPANLLATVTGPLIFTDSCNFTGTGNTTVTQNTTFDNVKVTTVPGQVITFTKQLISAKNSTTTFGGGGTFIFDPISNATKFKGNLDVGDTPLGQTIKNKDPTKVIINTKIQKKITIHSDGILRGVGPFNDISSEGTFWGGNLIGVVPIAGNYSCKTTSTTVVEFKPVVAGSTNNATKYEVAGIANLMGNLTLVTEVGGTYPMTFKKGLHEYLTVKAGKLMGKFNTLTAPDIPTFSYSLITSDDGNSLFVDLNVSQDTILHDGTHLDDGHGGQGPAFKTKKITAPYQSKNTQQKLLSAKINAAEAADSVIIAASLAIGGGNTSVTNSRGDSDSFRQKNLRPIGQGLHKDRLHTLLHALQENGPISIEQNQHRIWLSPFTTIGRTNASDSDSGNHRWTIGCLTGYEYRHVAKKLLIGLILGGSTGLQSVTGSPESWTRSKGLNTGIYAGTNLFGDARVESIALWIHNIQRKQRHGHDPTYGEYYAKSKFKDDTIALDSSFSYRFQLDDNWSIRPNIGHTFFYNKTGEATETNTPSPINTGASKSQTFQYYCGMGVRYSWKVNKKVFRITSVFELGREYYKKGSNINATTLDATGVIPPQVSSTSGVTKKVTTKYLTVHGAFLDEEKGIRYAISYSGQFSNGSRNHSVTLKFAKRF